MLQNKAKKLFCQKINGKDFIDLMDLTWYVGRGEKKEITNL